jgi:hypothetical protein
VTKGVPGGEASPTAAYELHDFQVVTIIQNGGGPAVAGDDIAVQLHRNPIGLHSEEIYKGGKGKWGLGVERARFAIDVKFHRLWIPVVRQRRRSLGTPEKRLRSG